MLLDSTTSKHKPHTLYPTPYSQLVGCQRTVYIVHRVLVLGRLVDGRPKFKKQKQNIFSCPQTPKGLKATSRHHHTSHITTPTPTHTKHRTHTRSHHLSSVCCVLLAVQYHSTVSHASCFIQYSMWKIEY